MRSYLPNVVKLITCLMSMDWQQQLCTEVAFTKDNDSDAILMV